jgi:ankyrin repeat protein
VHQASASGKKIVLECYLSKGVDVEIKNARGHTPLDLATSPEVTELIQKAIKTKNCSNLVCNSKFTFKNIRFYCGACTKFYCKNCSESMWVYECHDSEE